MGIYRGAGGTGDAVNDASSETRLAVEARDAAIAAKVAAETAQTNAELSATNAQNSAEQAVIDVAEEVNTALNAGTETAVLSSLQLKGGTTTTNPSITPSGNNLRVSVSTSTGSVLINTPTRSSFKGLVELTNSLDSWATVYKSTTWLTENRHIMFCRDTTTVGSITSSSTTTSYTTTSDYRLKTNIKPLANALSVVERLNPVTYTWKSSGKEASGFIAHELQSVVPDCVVGEKDAVFEDGSINPQSIDTSFLVATLTAAIQELHKEVSELKTKLNKLL